MIFFCYFSFVFVCFQLAYIRVRLSPASPVWEGRGEGREWFFFWDYFRHAGENAFSMCFTLCCGELYCVQVCCRVMLCHAVQFHVL